MSHESPSNNYERNEDIDDIIPDAKERVKAGLENDEHITDTMIEAYFDRCVTTDTEYFIMRGTAPSGDIVEQRILKKETLPGSKEAESSGSIETEVVIADFIKRTLRSGVDIDTLVNKDLSYRPEQAAE